MFGLQLFSASSMTFLMSHLLAFRKQFFGIERPLRIVRSMHAVESPIFLGIFTFDFRSLSRYHHIGFESGRHC